MFVPTIPSVKSLPMPHLHHGVAYPVNRANATRYFPRKSSHAKCFLTAEAFYTHVLLLILK